MPGRLWDWLESDPGCLRTVLDPALSLHAVTVYLHCTYTMEILLPVAKNINGQCLNNFRPVALTSQLVKVFEKVVLAQLKQ